MGDSKFEDTKRVAKEVGKIIGEDDYLVIVSTDLSHFYQYDRARELDAKSIGYILDGKVQELYEWDRSAGGMLCGVDGVLTIMQVAELRGWQPPVLLAYQNSGDRGGGRREVVGYAAVEYYGEAK